MKIVKVLPFVLFLTVIGCASVPRSMVTNISSGDNGSLLVEKKDLKGETSYQVVPVVPSAPPNSGVYVAPPGQSQSQNATK